MHELTGPLLAHRHPLFVESCVAYRQVNVALVPLLACSWYPVGTQYLLADQAVIGAASTCFNPPVHETAALFCRLSCTFQSVEEILMCQQK